MKKRDKTKAYVMGLSKQIMPKRKKKEIDLASTKVVLGKSRRGASTFTLSMGSEWYDQQMATHPMTPTESFKFTVLDLSASREVGTKEPVKGPKLKLTL